MLEDERAVIVIEMLVQTRRGVCDQAGQRGLAHGERIAAEVIAIMQRALRHSGARP
jgi:hypothetical protein